MFTSNVFNDTLFSNDETKENNIVTTYAYMDTESARKLMQFFVGSYYNSTKAYMNSMPVQLPIILYESKDMANMFKPATNYQLVAFDIDTNCKMYDDLNPVFKSKFKNKSEIQSFKESTDTLLLRELQKIDKSTNYYIQYTVRNKNVIKNIKLIDSK